MTQEDKELLLKENNMITEDYVSFETAKLLKEKGFDEPTLWFYVGDGTKYLAHKTLNKDWYRRPTIQMAMKWLREIYKLEVRSTYDYDKDSWWGNINPMFEETDENSDIYQKALGFDYQGKSYEQACEATIKYCLENLILIMKEIEIHESYEPRIEGNKDIIELKESEDERIRKGLLKIFKQSQNGYWAGMEIKDIVSYLEKQKPTEWSDGDKDYYDAIIAKLEVTQDDAMLTDNQMNFLKSLPERLNIQPKQEWSEDYREEDIQTRFAFYTYKDDPSVLYLSNVFVEEASRNHGFGTRILRAAEKVAEAIGATTISLKVKQDSTANAWYRKHGYKYLTFEDGYDWLEKTLEYLKPVKQEWSEEDERHRVHLVGLLEEVQKWAEQDGMHHLCIARCEESLSWLKSLPERFNLQPHQEWSEEEEKMYDELTWFHKSNWKPNDEQMKQLSAVIDAYPKGSRTHKVLTSLYDDLKKLS